jgi:hypothetical protein
MLDNIGNIVVGPTFVERVFRPGRRSFLDHRLDNYTNGLQVALLADSCEQGGDQPGNDVSDGPTDSPLDGAVQHPRLNK